MRKYFLTSTLSILLVGLTYVLPYGFWAEVGSLPAHPLIVHSVVVAVPLISLLLIIGILKRDFLKKFYFQIIIALTVMNITVLAAKSSGDSLSAAVGLPEFHAEWGNNLVPIVMAQLLIFIVFIGLSKFKKLHIASLAMSVLMGLTSASAIGLTYIVGHSGAESVWKYKYTNAQGARYSVDNVFSREEISTHNSVNDCWTIVGKNVYDVSSFVNRHPAGSQAIKEMCGRDASEEFLGEHQGQKEPEKWLQTLKVGTLKQ